MALHSVLIVPLLGGLASPSGAPGAWNQLCLGKSSVQISPLGPTEAVNSSPHPDTKSAFRRAACRPMRPLGPGEWGLSRDPGMLAEVSCPEQDRRPEPAPTGLQRGCEVPVRAGVAPIKTGSADTV